MTIKILFQIYSWDGADRHNPTDYYFESEEMAMQYKNKIDQHCDIYKKKLIICSSIEDYKQNTIVELRKRALEKLTPEERCVLGLE